MNRQEADSRWPYYVVAVCLLLLSLAAPASWRAVGKRPQGECAEPTAVVPQKTSAWPSPAPSAAVLVKDPPTYPDPNIMAAVPVEPASTTTESPLFTVGPPPSDEVCRSPATDALMASDTEPAVTDKAPSAVGFAWPAPQSLMSQLDVLAEQPQCREWIEELRIGIVALTAGERLLPAEFSLLVQDLRRTLGRLDAVEAAVHDERIRSALRRVHYATVRRADIWEAAHAVASPAKAIDPLPDRLASNSHVVSVVVKAPSAEHPQTALIREALLELERYETFGASQPAARLGAIRAELTATGDDACVQLARRIESHYRNANLRVVCSGYLLNRMLQQPHDTIGDIDDVVAGVPVRGRHLTSTQLLMRLVPDKNRIRLGLEAHGEVAADTEALAGPATLESEGETSYLARKLVLYDGSRMHVWPAVAAANERSSRLRRIRTDVDGVPFVSSIVQSIVRSKHDRSRGQVRWEVEEMVSEEARQQLDARADGEVRNLQETVIAKLIDPATRLHLEPTALELSTTEQRITGRFRMAGPNQLGAHTARPRAPGDSVLSLQVHESALNNAVAGLCLDGKTFTLRGVYEMVAARLGNPSLKAPEDLPDDVHVTFAASDPVRLRLESGRVEVKLRLARLVAERRTWRDLTVIAYYQPQSRGLDAQFVRKDSIRLTGYRIDTRSSLALRGVFSKMFTRSRPLQLLPDQILNDRRLNDLHVHQLVVEDGWMGLSLGRIAGGSL
jgi:hypothetical protein